MARYYRSTEQQNVSQFIPQNLAQQQGFFDDLQKNQDAYKLSINGLDKDTNALANDVAGAMEAKKQVESKLESLRSLNYNDPKQQQAAQKEIMNIRNQFSPFGELGAREEKLKKYNAAVQEIEKDKNDFKKAFRLQQLQQSNLAPEAAIKFDPYGKPLNTEIITPPDFEYKDKTKVFSELLKDVAADAKSVNSGLTQEKAHEALLSYMNGNIEERTGAKIYNSIKERALADPNLINSIKAEGAYFKQDVDQLFESALQGVVTGGRYIKPNVDKKYMTDNLAEKRALKSDEIKDANILTTSQSEALPGSLITIPKELESLEFTESGDLKPITKATYKNIEGSKFASSLTGGQPTFAPKGKEGFDMEANKNAVQMIQNFQTQYPSLKGLKPKQVVEAIKKGYKSLEEESIPLISTSGPASDNIGKALSRNKAQRNFYLYDGQGKTSDGQLETVLKELDITEEDLNKSLEKGIAGVTQAGPTAGGYYIEVPDNKGKTRRVIISPDKEIGDIFKASQLVNESRKTLMPSKVQPHEGSPYTIFIKPQISKDGNTTWEYEETKLNEDGSIALDTNGKPIIEKTNLDEIRKGEREFLKQSNFLGSQLDILKPNTTQ